MIGKRKIRDEGKKGFDQFAILELMGHRKLIGRVKEAEIAGVIFIQIDVLDSDGEGYRGSHFYNPNSAYGIIPITEESAKELVKANRAETMTFRITQPSLGPAIGEPEGIQMDLIEEDEEAELEET